VSVQLLEVKVYTIRWAVNGFQHQQTVMFLLARTISSIVVVLILLKQAISWQNTFNSILPSFKTQKVSSTRQFDQTCKYTLSSELTEIKSYFKICKTEII